MKQILSHFLLCYYLCGIICLPIGDFSTITDLPKMYSHCKLIEDKEMTPFDFITDHLINIDGLFDKHENGDHQKPHNPPPVNHQVIHFYYAMIFSNDGLNSQEVLENIQSTFRNQFYYSDFIKYIFHPPLC